MTRIKPPCPVELAVFNLRTVKIGIAVVIALGMMPMIFSLFLARSISAEVEQLHRSPFTVSNAAQRIQTEVLSMKVHMLLAGLAKNEQMLESEIQMVSDSEQRILNSLALVENRFLGDQDQVEEVSRTFALSQKYRSKVLALYQAGQMNEGLQFIVDTGGETQPRLDAEVQDLVDSAFLTAAESQDDTAQTLDFAVRLNVVLAIAVIIIGLIIGRYLVRGLSRANEEIAERRRVIDHNVLIASMDPQGTVQDVTECLAEFLGKPQSELVGTQSYFFNTGADSSPVVAEILDSIQAGEPWAGEICYQRPDKEQSWAKSSIIPKLDDQGLATGVTNVLVDITSDKLSVTDPLTSIGNRRRFEGVISRELLAARRNTDYVTLAIADIDFFKDYNDCYGHPAGDDALRQVAQRLSNRLRRPRDYIFRVGGEEFALIFSGMDAVQSKEYLEELRESVENLQTPHETSSISNYLTISIGARLVSPDETIDKTELYELADQALYQAKEQRNRVVLSR